MRPEEVVSRVFGVHRADVTDETSNRTLPAWDSMAHVTLILELESSYGVSLSTEDALQMTTVAEIKRVLTGHGVSW